MNEQLWEGEEYRGDWMQTLRGGKFWPLSPRAEDIEIEDIAHALSMLCRFTGHTRVFYSVAQHSVLVSENVSPEAALWGLLHDAHEAYIGDMSRPLKVCLRGIVGDKFDQIGQRIDACIEKRFCIFEGKTADQVTAIKAEVKTADNMLLATEARDLFDKIADNWNAGMPMLEKGIQPWGSVEAFYHFTKRFKELTNGR